jgi:hypothetical protein
MADQLPFKVSQIQLWERSLHARRDLLIQYSLIILSFFTISHT